MGQVIPLHSRQSVPDVELSLKLSDLEAQCEAARGDLLALIPALGELETKIDKMLLLLPPEASRAGFEAFKAELCFRIKEIRARAAEIVADRNVLSKLD